MVNCHQRSKLAMNTQRLIVLGIALVAAGGAAFLVRGMLGGGTPAAQAKPAPVIAMSEVLVANTNLAPGQALSVEQVRWQKWPTASVDPSFITHEAVGSEEQAVKGTVVRAPILQGQPIISTSIVHGDASGFMAATLTDGMRAVSIAISADSSAGGFILPNDRVDVILTRKPQGNSPRGYAKTILSNLRVLAVDQIFRQDKDTRTVVGKTATVEVTPEQAETISAAGSAGQLSLSLRPLSDANIANADDVARKHRSIASDGPVSVIRYGMAGSGAQQEPQ
jgi:pilus assembly protein CpaB